MSRPFPLFCSRSCVFIEIVKLSFSSREFSHMHHEMFSLNYMFGKNSVLGVFYLHPCFSSRVQITLRFVWSDKCFKIVFSRGYLALNLSFKLFLNCSFFHQSELHCSYEVCSYKKGE